MAYLKCDRHYLLSRSHRLCLVCSFLPTRNSKLLSMPADRSQTKLHASSSFSNFENAKDARSSSVVGGIIGETSRVAPLLLEDGHSSNSPSHIASKEIYNLPSSSNISHRKADDPEHTMQPPNASSTVRVTFVL